MQPQIIRPLERAAFEDLQRHIREIRRAFEGTPYHDSAEPMRFNRWYWHNLPLLKKLHAELAGKASEVFGEKVKPSYVFLSMYGDQGICPGHIDRPQCKYTIDLCVSQGKPWEIFVGDDVNDKQGKPYVLNEGDALCYSGTDQWHYRNRIESGNWINLAFFHFVPENFSEGLN